MQQLILRAREDLVYTGTAARPAAGPGSTVLRVLYCGVCRTDAKMWRSGHRDLLMPRVPGHEIAAIEEKTQKLCTVWPGTACGSCQYCLTGNENLCDSMRILGFHQDGGFAEYVSVSLKSIVYVQEELPAYLLCFCEPLACIHNALSEVFLRRGARVIIYGAGVVGLLAALVCRDNGAYVTVIEQNITKISKAKAFADALKIRICEDTAKGDFDIGILCCDSPEAFAQSIVKIRKRGRLCYFSGLAQQRNVTTEILNSIHYRELLIQGSYGPRPRDMTEAYRTCSGNKNLVVHLVEELVSPESAAHCLAAVAAGKTYKYIIDFTRKA